LVGADQDVHLAVAIDVGDLEGARLRLRAPARRIRAVGVTSLFRRASFEDMERRLVRRRNRVLRFGSLTSARTGLFRCQASVRTDDILSHDREPLLPRTKRGSPLNLRF
jgi:hypothetical protein